MNKVSHTKPLHSTGNDQNMPCRRKKIVRTDSDITSANQTWSYLLLTHRFNVDCLHEIKRRKRGNLRARRRDFSHVNTSLIGKRERRWYLWQTFSHVFNAWVWSNNWTLLLTDSSNWKERSNQQENERENLKSESRMECVLVLMTFFSLFLAKATLRDLCFLPFSRFFFSKNTQRRYTSVSSRLLSMTSERGRKRTREDDQARNLLFLIFFQLHLQFILVFEWLTSIDWKILNASFKSK